MGKTLTCGDWRVNTEDSAGSAVMTVRSEQNSELKQTNVHFVQNKLVPEE